MGTPRLVIVHRRTELEELLARHATLGQTEFFLRTRGRTIAGVRERHELLAAALATIRAANPADWRRAEVERADLNRFMFTPEDIIAVVGQDGLVANVAKYLTGQPVIGIDPEPGVNPGVLVRHAPADAARLLRERRTGRGKDSVALPGTCDGDGAARRRSRNFRGSTRFSSGTEPTSRPATSSRRRTDGASGNRPPGSSFPPGRAPPDGAPRMALERGGRTLPAPTDPRLAWFVREAWPSPGTGTSLTEGALEADELLRLTVASDQLVVFGDGMEQDRLTASWGQEISVQLGVRPLRLA